MEKKLTPVEWLHNRLQTEPFLTNEDFEKAKVMEAERPAPDSPKVSDENVELSLKVNCMIHDECNNVPHDIGFRVMEMVRSAKSNDAEMCEFAEWVRDGKYGAENIFCTKEEILQLFKNRNK